MWYKQSVASCFLSFLCSRWNHRNFHFWHQCLCFKLKICHLELSEIYGTWKSKIYGTWKSGIYGTWKSEIYDTGKIYIYGTRKGDCYGTRNSGIYGTWKGVIYDTGKRYIYGTRKGDFYGTGKSGIYGQEIPFQHFSRVGSSSWNSQLDIHYSWMNWNNGKLENLPMSVISWRTACGLWFTHPYLHHGASTRHFGNVAHDVFGCHSFTCSTLSTVNTHTHT